jgi:uncharacterized membrane protein
LAIGDVLPSSSSCHGVGEEKRWGGVVLCILELVVPELGYYNLKRNNLSGHEFLSTLVAIMWLLQPAMKTGK